MTGRELYFWCKVCGGWWSNLCSFSSDHGRGCQVRGPGCTGMIPGRCATEKKVSSLAGGLFGSQSSWSAMMFPRFQVKFSWSCDGGGLIWTELGTKRTRTLMVLVCFSFCAFVPEQWFLPYLSELYQYVFVLVCFSYLIQVWFLKKKSFTKTRLRLRWIEKWSPPLPHQPPSITQSMFFLLKKDCNFSDRRIRSNSLFYRSMH